MALLGAIGDAGTGGSWPLSGTGVPPGGAVIRVPMARRLGVTARERALHGPVLSAVSALDDGAAAATGEGAVELDGGKEDGAVGTAGADDGAGLGDAAPGGCCAAALL